MVAKSPVVSLKELAVAGSFLFATAVTTDAPTHPPSLAADATTAVTTAAATTAAAPATTTTTAAAAATLATAAAAVAALVAPAEPPAVALLTPSDTTPEVAATLVALAPLADATTNTTAPGTEAFGVATTPLQPLAGLAMAQLALCEEDFAHLADVTIAPPRANDATTPLVSFADTALSMMAAPVPEPAARYVMRLADVPPKNAPAPPEPAPVDVLPGNVALDILLVTTPDVVASPDDTDTGVALAVLLRPALPDLLAANTEKANATPPELPTATEPPAAAPALGLGLGGRGHELSLFGLFGLFVRCLAHLLLVG